MNQGQLLLATVGIGFASYFAKQVWIQSKNGFFLPELDGACVPDGHIRGLQGRITTIDYDTQRSTVSGTLITELQKRSYGSAFFLHPAQEYDLVKAHFESHTQQVIVNGELLSNMGTGMIIVSDMCVNGHNIDSCYKKRIA